MNVFFIVFCILFVVGIIYLCFSNKTVSFGEIHSHKIQPNILLAPHNDNFTVIDDKTEEINSPMFMNPFN